MNIQEIRAKYPQYDNLSDEQLAQGLHKKYYPDMDYADFSQRIGLAQSNNTAEDILGGVTSFDTGYSAGFGRKLGGLINAIGSYPVDRAAEALGVENTPTFSDRYNEIVKPALQAQEKFAEENPLTSTALQVGGALASPINKLGVGMISKPTTLLGKIATGGAVGAGTGGIYGAGRAESLQELPETIAEDVKTGGIIGGAFPAAGQALRGLGNVASRILGMTTGTYSDAIKQAYSAGQRGSQKFKQNISGQVSRSDVLEDVERAINKLKGRQSKAYQQGMEPLGKTESIQLEPILNTVKDSINKYSGNKPYLLDDKSKVVIKQINDRLKSFIRDKGARTLDDFDDLKKSIGKISVPLEANEAKAIKTSVYNSIKNEINKQAPEYSKVMKDFSEASEVIDELKQLSGMKGGKIKNPESSIRKLQSALRNNAQSGYGTRGEILKNFENEEIADAVAGQALSSWTPRGLLSGSLGGGIGAISAYTNPSTLLSFPAFMPRAVGETAYGIGRVSRAIPEYTSKIPYANKIKDNINFNPAAVWLQLLGEE